MFVEFFCTFCVLYSASAADQSLDSPHLHSQSVQNKMLVQVQADHSDSRFRNWVARFRVVALRKGISATTFDQAFKGVRFDPDVVQKDRNQSEFTRPLWDYLDRAVSRSRITNGRRAIRTHRRQLQDIEDTYGVEKEVVAAIWGIESAYGKSRGDVPVIEALASLAFDGRRGRFFEQQLVAALRILQQGNVAPSDMTGSWAGAMGHTQFIPTSFLAYAVDHDGDGRRNIWADDPTDALASTAAYLARFGWRKGQPWGVEVQLPNGFDYALAGAHIKRPAATWRALGLRDVQGNPVPDFGPASVLLPAGAQGPALLIFNNFHVIERYNKADAYVIAVGHLSDRLGNGRAFQAKWLRQDRSLTAPERRELQQRLSAAGFDTMGVDGLIGPNTIGAIRRFQTSVGMVPDGYPSLELLRKLR